MLIDFKNYGYRYKKMWLYVFLFPILLLCHEAIFFLMPYIISALIIFINKTNRKKIISQIFVLLFISLITELIIYNFKGDLHTAIFICESLGHFRPDNCVTNGAIAALAGDSSSFGIWLTYHDLKGYLTFLFVFFYGFFPFILFSLFINYKPNNKHSFNSKNITHSLFLFPFIFTLILFYMANDWGRWLSLNYFLMFYLLSHLIYHKFIVVVEDNILGIKIYNLKKINKILCIFVIFIYSSFFRMPNYYLPEREGLKIQYVDIYKNLSTWIKKHYL